mmetsp:Transcript_6054/g.9146  ORF Transcript_6054/g.9146 Transcript_6054/m.9146 type:complete len:516 (-) Transcript_6054:369-1916(-)|eukprot:CAMPEP_0185041766 /NCGR_PEP_ID=MMETSP1103-20130426/41481_1 /TAXON_ID=36769 /ORGANISM="Paraphysomonas bandaiensis, Strain Caron Lab Isolate" /LENGTH=515 /DNA_ID=CAMNT_0027581647 /DNA_START=143 /DNA_END=1690 /DNA_ORIENTATION=+
MGGAVSNSSYIHAGNDVSKTDFTFHQSIGKGQFAQVFLVSHRHNNEIFAAKEISLKQIWENDVKSEVLLNETTALIRLNGHPFISELAYSFVDGYSYYLVIALLNGGSIRDHLCDDRVFTERSASYIIACVASAVEYIHSKRILHRDIKPDNIVLDDRGYPHLVDFGICYIEPPGRVFRKSGGACPGLTCTCTSGTQDYSAPEIYTPTHAHGTEADYWALGVTMYEMIFCSRPFYKRVPPEFVKYAEKIRCQKKDWKHSSCGPCASESSKSNLTNVISASYDSESVSGHFSRASSTGVRSWSYKLTDHSSSNSVRYQESTPVEIFRSEDDDESEEHDTPLSSTFSSSRSFCVPPLQHCTSLPEIGENYSSLPSNLRVRIPLYTACGERVTNSCSDLIQSLLDPNAERRPGGRNCTAGNILEHLWFEEHSVSPIVSLEEKVLPLPFCPPETALRLCTINKASEVTPDADRPAPATSWISKLRSSRPRDRRLEAVHKELGNCSYVSVKYRSPVPGTY